ncbi:MAG TPA: response regulator [Blastocatellia bacterium]|nr:response regulator [Blastocatellia bacterium]
MTRVLVVDDKAENLYLLRVLLQGHGYIVEEASNGADALTKARQNPPDLAVSDLLMPVLDGYTLLRQWRADERLKGIPFVVYTATYTEPRDERLALALGADAFLLKPAEPEKFVLVIQDVLAKDANGGRRTEPRPEEVALLHEYNEVLVRKLESKVLQWEQTNRELVEEIAERRRKEEALRLRDRAIQTLSQGIVITDPRQPDNPIIYASGGFERMTGYTADEAIGRNCRFLQGYETDRETVSRLQESVAAGRSCEVEILNYRKDRTSFWNALSLNPVHDDEGGLAYFVGVQTDVTDRKNLEDQLRQSQKMEAIGQLAGGVAHDFNNLLTVINGYADISMIGLRAEDPLLANLKEIKNAGQKASALTNQLLAFSRKQITRPRVLNLNRVVSDLSKMLCRLIGEDIELKLGLTEDLGSIKADSGQIEQIILNLAVNARDAMPHGGKLSIETANIDIDEEYARRHVEASPGPHVMLAISDTGVGIAKDVKPRIFEPFFTTKAAGKGTGLGLSTVYGIVRQSGGSIEVYSEPGLGTAFKVYLPRVNETPEALEIKPAAHKLEGTETVLLCEDDDTVRALARNILEGNGYRVLEAANGGAALLICETYDAHIDLLFTDVVMPEMNGPALAERLAKLRPEMKVLYMSGYTSHYVVNHGVLDEDTNLINKPFTLNDLLIKLREVLDHDN